MVVSRKYIVEKLKEFEVKILDNVNRWNEEEVTEELEKTKHLLVVLNHIEDVSQILGISYDVCINTWIDTPKIDISIKNNKINVWITKKIHDNVVKNTIYDENEKDWKELSRSQQLNSVIRYLEKRYETLNGYLKFLEEKVEISDSLYDVLESYSDSKE